MTSRVFVRTLIGCLMAGLIATTGAGCATKKATAEAASGVDLWCATNKPEIHTHAEYERMSREAREEMWAHNKLGETYCGWKP